MTKVEWVGGPYDGAHSTVPEACLREGYMDIAETIDLAGSQTHADGQATSRTQRLRIPIRRVGQHLRLVWAERQIL